MELKNEKKQEWFKWAALGLICANLFVWLVLAESGRQKFTEVRFFDVGQGDAAFVQTARGTQIIIDGGPGNSVLEKLGRAMPFYDRQIDWMILSHPDSDHLSGLLAVLENYRVDNIVWSGIGKDSDECRQWEAMIAREGARIFEVSAPDRFSLDGGDVVVEILLPESESAGAKESSNNLSVAARIIHKNRAFLFAGDIDAEKEALLFGANPDLRADVLKIAHHGSKYSANEEFTAGLATAAAVISCGKDNRHGHPHPETLDLLEKYDIKTLRTDDDGNIVFRTDGERVFVRTQK